MVINDSVDLAFWVAATATTALIGCLAVEAFFAIRRKFEQRSIRKMFMEMDRDAGRRY